MFSALPTRLTPRCFCLLTHAMCSRIRCFLALDSPALIALNRLSFSVSASRSMATLAFRCCINMPPLACISAEPSLLSRNWNLFFAAVSGFVTPRRTEEKLLRGVDVPVVVGTGFINSDVDRKLNLLIVDNDSAALKIPVMCSVGVQNDVSDSLVTIENPAGMGVIQLSRLRALPRTPFMTFVRGCLRMSCRISEVFIFLRPRTASLTISSTTRDSEFAPLITRLASTE